MKRLLAIIFLAVVGCSAESEVVTESEVATESDIATESEVATYLDITTEGDITTNSIGMELRLIPAGTFMMGSDEGYANDKPAHQVTITQPFLLGVYEVTQEQYERVMGSNPSKFKGSDNPVDQVSWDDAVEFCEKLSVLPKEKTAGYAYRLPTEAEWEYSCRAETATKYSFGDEETQLGEYAWFKGNANDQPHPVGEKKPNAWGLYDMHGNVWEWCMDRYGDYTSVAVTDPKGAASGMESVSRGGSWANPAKYCRSACRGRTTPQERSGNKHCGFRVACVRSGQSGNLQRP